jgi:hypothetical protein
MIEGKQRSAYPVPRPALRRPRVVNVRDLVLRGFGKTAECRFERAGSQNIFYHNRNLSLSDFAPLCGEVLVAFIIPSAKKKVNEKTFFENHFLRRNYVHIAKKTIYEKNLLDKNDVKCYTVYHCGVRNVRHHSFHL